MIVFLCDLDGTLANIDHRLHFIKGEKKDWKSFFGEIKNDKVNEWCRQLIMAMKLRGYEIVYATGRTGSHEVREDTVVWLMKNGLYENGIVYFREDGDYRPDHVVKKEMFEKDISSHHNVLFVVDDRKRVVDMWRSLGFVCLQCAKGNF